MTTLRTWLQLELSDSVAPLLYVCRPTFFGVNYVINPWMTDQIGNVDRGRAIEQWTAFIKILRRLTQVRTLSCPYFSLPDVTFIANAGSMLPEADGRYRFTPSLFTHPERQAETEFFASEFRWEGVRVDEPPCHAFEGDGDLLRLRDRLIVGYGMRTEEQCAGALAVHHGFDAVLPVRLVNPHFYHLDTCFFYHNFYTAEVCMYYPKAFDARSLTKLRKLLKELKLEALEVTEEEAKEMSCNAVGVGTNVIAHSFSDRIVTYLKDHKFKAITTDLSEFHKAGGSAKCLTFRVPSAALR